MLSCTNNGINKNHYYNECMEYKEQGANFFKKCEDLENKFIQLTLLEDNSASSYYQLIEKLTDDQFLKRREVKNQLNDFLIENNIEMDSYYYIFLECMYSSLIVNKTLLTSTSYIQYHTFLKLDNSSFSYTHYKHLIDNSVKNNDFDQIENRLIFLLGISYHLLYELN